MSGKRKGQSTLEYVLVFTAITAGIVAVTLAPINAKDKDSKKGGIIAQKVQASLEHGANQLEATVKAVNFGKQQSTAQTGGGGGGRPPADIPPGEQPQ